MYMSMSLASLRGCCTIEKKSSFIFLMTYYPKLQEKNGQNFCVLLKQVEDISFPLTKAVLCLQSFYKCPWIRLIQSPWKATDHALKPNVLLSFKPLVRYSIQI